LDSYIIEATKSKATSKNIEIRTIKLDSLNYNKPICLLKIDVQGNEINVFKGMSKILKNIRYIIFEHCPMVIIERSESFPNAYRILKEENFKLRKFLDHVLFTK